MCGQIGLLTLEPHTFNYGGLLQEYALQMAIQSLGYDCEIMDYCNDAERYTFSVKRDIRNLTLKKCYNKLVPRPKKEEGNDLVDAVYARRMDKFDAFRRVYMKFSPSCTYDELPQMAGKYETIVCGSDQIWNPSFNRPSFFLEFVPDSVGKIIYAASIGRDGLSGREKKVYAQYLRALDWISVRESGAQKLVRELAADKCIKLVLDPTLLLDPLHWMQIAGEKRLVQQKYVFCYFLGMDGQKRNAAVDFAAHHGLKIISAPYLHGRYESLDEGFSEEELDVGPIEFLNLIRYADFVLTDSFHASVFSILFRKDFRVFGRAWETGDMNTRIHTLLDYIGKRDILITPSQLGESTAGKPQGWDLGRIEQQRSESMGWLQTALTNTNQKE